MDDITKEKYDTNSEYRYLIVEYREKNKKIRRRHKKKWKIYIQPL